LYKVSYYTLVTGKFREFLEAIKKAKPPVPRATLKWLGGLGFKSKNHRVFLKLLQQIRFLDSNNVPTELYHEFRVDKTSKLAMAKGLRKGYSILWDTYTEPHKETPDALVDVFKAEGMGEDVAKRSENTFRVLADFADFDALEKAPHEPKKIGGTEEPLKPQFSAEQLKQLLAEAKESKEKRELAVNINIQISLPEKGEPEVYDKIFASLKKHFFSE